MAMLGRDASGCGDEVVVSLRGDLDVVSASAALAVVAAAAIRGQPVVVDLAELDFLDCSAVDLLMQARVVAQESGSDVVLVNSRGSVLRTLTILGLAECLQRQSVAA
jgi:anti-anti-sigma factor